MPVKEGYPDVNAFELQTFDDIKHVFLTEALAKYAHCIVAKSVSVVVPSFILFVLGTDSKYDHSDIVTRFNLILLELKKLGITVVSNGADGAGRYGR